MVKHSLVFILVLAIAILFAACAGEDPGRITVPGLQVDDNALPGSNRDTDADGLTDQEEVSCGSNPNLQDTDLDGLSDFAECKTHHTNPANKDTDGDTGEDMWELVTNNSDPRNADDDNDGVDGPEDCKPWDGTVFPGNLGANGEGDQVNGVDIDCKVDVKFAEVTFQKGYSVEATLDDDFNLFVKAFTRPVSFPSEAIECGGTHHGAEDRGECRVDPVQGCLNGACNLADEAQPYTSDHACQSWTTTVASRYDLATCQYVQEEGIGFKALRLSQTEWNVIVVGKMNNSNSPAWGTMTLVLGE